MKHRRRRKSHFGRIVKFFLGLLFLGAAGYFVVKFGPLMLSGKFDSAQRFNVVLSAPSKTSLLSLDSGGNKATIVNFPQELYVTKVAHGYGQYPIGKVFEVGELDRRGGQVLSDTVSLYLGVPVDGYVRLSDFSLGEVKSNVLSMNFILSTKSNINLWDRILFAKSLLNLRFDRINEVDLSRKSEPLLLADGSVAKVFLEEDLDKLLNGKFTEKQIVREGLRVQIINATDQVGLGRAFARIISSLGSTVVDVSTEGENLDVCEVRAAKKIMKSKTVGRIAKILGCVIIEGDSGRADAALFLGRKQGGIYGN